MDTAALVSLQDVKDFLGITVSKLDMRLSLMTAAATTEIEQATGRFFTKQPFTEYFTGKDNVNRSHDLMGGPRLDNGFYGGGYDGVSPTITSAIRGTATQTLRLKGVGIDPTVQPKVWFDPYANLSDTPYGPDSALTYGRHFIVDFDNDAILLFVGTRFSPRAIKVSYVAGYEVTPAIAGDAQADPPVMAQPANLSAAIPDNLKMAALTQIQFMNVKLRSDNIGMGAERTSNKRDTVSASPFIVTNGVTPEVASMLRYLKRVGVGKG